MRPRALTLATLILLGTPSAPSRAGADIAAFLTGLTRRGYADLARDYLERLDRRGGLPTDLNLVATLQRAGLVRDAVWLLERLDARKDLPADVRKDIDFTLGRAVLVQAESAEDDATRDRLLGEATKRLDRYLAGQPHGERADDARLDLADIKLRKARRLVDQAEHDEKSAAALRDLARPLAKEARQALEEVIASVQQRLRELPGPHRAAEPPPRRTPTDRSGPIVEREAKSPRDRLIATLALAELNRAIAGFEIARTFPPGDAARTEAFAAAATEFDAIYQRFRLHGALVGLYAHLWHGRSLAELGDGRGAIGLFDETLMREPPRSSNVSPEARRFFAEAWLVRLKALNQFGRHEEVVEEETGASARDWLRLHPEDRFTPAGLGIQFELATALIKRAEAQPAESPERRQAIQQALSALREGPLAHPSPYRAEAFQLRERLSRQVKDGAKPANFGEAAFLAKESFEARDWPATIEGCQLALSLLKGTEEAKSVADVKYRLAYSFLKTNRLEEAIRLATEVAAEDTAGALIPKALGVSIASRYGRALGISDTSARNAEYDAVLASAEKLEKGWPRSTEADQARRLRGAILASRQRYAEAAAAFESVTAIGADLQLRAGQCYSLALAQTFAKPPSTRDPAEVAKLTVSARRALEAAVKSYGESPHAPAGAKADAELSLAELALRERDLKAAEQILGGLLSHVIDATEGDLVGLTLRAIAAGLELAIARGQFSEADALIERLAGLPPEKQEQLTRLLAGLARRLDTAARQLEEEGKPDDANKARKLLLVFLNRLAEREGQDFNALGFIADAYFELGEFAAAADQYGRMLILAARRPDFAPPDRRATDLARTQLRRAVALRRMDRYADAMASLDELGRSSPRGLSAEASFEKGELLLDWGKVDGQKLTDAARHFSQLARRYETISPPPEEFFRARYQLAQALVRMDRSADAARVLRSTLTQHPSGGGPALKAELLKLLDELNR